MQMMKKRTISFGCFSIILIILILFSLPSQANELNIKPSLELRAEYDDNIDFTDSNETDDFGGYAIPRLTLDYATELLQVALIGEVNVLKYYDETDFDRINHLYGIDGQYRIAPRWNFAGNFRYRRDENIDTQLEETGQAFDRERVNTYDGGGGLYYQFTELTDVGMKAEYRRRDYGSSTSNDYQRYTFFLPYTKRFANQRDTLSLTPSYSIFDSDNSEDAKDYRFTAGWERRISETLSSEIQAGVRYTDIEQATGDNDTNWGYLGKLRLRQTTETFSGEVAVSRDLRANSNAEIVEVNRLLIRADKRLLERLGIRFYGSAYYTKTEANEAVDEKTTFFELEPSIYYYLTENHSLDLKYQYQNEKELDRPDDPVTQRNRVSLGLTLRFPQKW